MGGRIVGIGDCCVVKGEVAEGLMKLMFMIGDSGVGMVEEGSERGFGAVKPGHELCYIIICYVEGRR